MIGIRVAILTRVESSLVPIGFPWAEHTWDGRGSLSSNC